MSYLDAGSHFLTPCPPANGMFIGAVVLGGSHGDILTRGGGGGRKAKQLMLEHSATDIPHFDPIYSKRADGQPHYQ